MVQTLHAKGDTVGKRRPYIIECLYSDLTHGGPWIKQFISHQHIFLLGRVHHVFNVSFQLGVAGFELQSRTKYVPKAPMDPSGPTARKQGH